MKKIIILVMICFSLFVISCKKKQETVKEETKKETTENVETSPIKSETQNDPFYYIGENEYKDYVKGELNYLFSVIKEELSENDLPKCQELLSQTIKAIDEGSTINEVMKANNSFYNGLNDIIPLASGVESFKLSDGQEKTYIFSLLENYAISNGLNGLSLSEKANLYMISPRIVLKTQDYIPGYGFGILEEGIINDDLDSESNPNWKKYYHISRWGYPENASVFYEDLYPKEFYDYFSASFYKTFMNDEGNGYSYVPELAMSNRPIALDQDYEETTKSKSWKIEVKTFENGGLTYSTNSLDEERARFNNRGVKLEDYEYTFKMLLTKANHLFRGVELAGYYNVKILGAKDYYNLSEDGFNSEAWENVGIKTYEEDGKPYLEIEFEEAISGYDALYYFANTLLMPIPSDFIELVGIENYCSCDGDFTPVDNSLSLGGYVLEEWNDDLIVYKKNQNYVYASSKYAIEGIHIIINDGPNPYDDYTDFLDGKLDFSMGAAITNNRDIVEKYFDDPRTKKAYQGSNIRFSINSCDQETWEYLFGENGTYLQTPKEEYWETKPILNNKHFVKGLSYAIDRLEFANINLLLPSVNYIPYGYFVDLEGGIAYNNTTYHKKVISQLLDGTDGYGYSFELAKDYFKMALSELEAKNIISPGTKEEPTIFKIEVAWQYPKYEEQYHNVLKEYIEKAFNDDDVSGGKYKLELVFWVGDNWTDVYYKKLYVSQYDIVYGNPTGSGTINPIDLLRYISTDPLISGNYTDNFRIDTNNPNNYPLVYNGKRWSYDALYQALSNTSIVMDGVNKHTYDFSYNGLEKTEDGYIASVILDLIVPDVTIIEIGYIELCDYGLFYGSNYKTYKTIKTGELEGFSFDTKQEGNKLIVNVFISNSVAQSILNDYLALDGTSNKDEYYGYIGLNYKFDTYINDVFYESRYEVIDDYLK